ncbi:PREDICTED: LOW QUALITY PROTEIN: F-box/LRR-repeat protein 12-like [Gavialis gangeticus]|uniref:LOW QUALITY PROTEIN: F-box/LRR-repeat protein 12-like n=1 Tax=Gavialis gangeticus TaxID=94835 RepID=UPI00092F045B|nr:PREDICTED: LOW QUALITY PROTEIN: F-box/LRR-repeat protein 12-like [Gavialis gangeticus]
MVAVVAEPSLDALADSLLLEILSQLQLRERLLGARVCRRWCRLVQDKVLWRHVDLTPYEISLKNLRHLLQHHLCSNVRTLKMRGTLSEALLQDLGKKCPGLQRLCLLRTKLRYKIDSYVVPSPLMTLELSRLELSQWIFFAKSEGTRGLLQLKHLFIYEVPSFSDLHLLNISSLVCLQTLTLSGTNQVTTLGFCVALSYLKALEHLTLCQCTLKDSATHFIGCYLKQLHTLEFSNTPFLTDAGLPDLKSSKYLEPLSLESCVKLSCDAIVALGQALPQLKSLNLRGIPFDDQTICKIQASLPNCHFSPS